MLLAISPESWLISLAADAGLCKKSLPHAFLSLWRHGAFALAQVNRPLGMLLTLSEIVQDFHIEMRFAVPRVIEKNRIRAINSIVTQEGAQAFFIEFFPVIQHPMTF